MPVPFAHTLAMSSHPHILVVSDAASSAPLCAYLRGFRFEVTALTSSAELLTQLARERFDLVVLDLKLPGSGLGLLRALRAASATAIIVLGDLASATDRVVGLEMGADDCLDQPFVNRELVARIQTVLRRTRGASMQATHAGMPTDLIRFDGWELQRSERKLRSPAGQPVSLSNAEFRLLDTFLKAPRRVVSRDQLASQARDCATGDFARSIDLLVSRLRQKLAGQSGDNTLICTVRGLGYRFDARSVEGAASHAA